MKNNNQLDWEKEFNRFIVKWCGIHVPHLLDDDDNEGEVFRQFTSSLLKEKEDKVIENFCKDKTVIEEFKCGEHGIQKPMASCPKCTLYGGREGLVKEIRETLYKEIEGMKVEERDVKVGDKIKPMKLYDAFKRRGFNLAIKKVLSRIKR